MNNQLDETVYGSGPMAQTIGKYIQMYGVRSSPWKYTVLAKYRSWWKIYGPELKELKDRPVSTIWTVQFWPFELSSFIPLNRPVSSLWTVHFWPFEPSGFISLDRPVSSLWTVYFYSLRPLRIISSDRTVFFLRTVHFRRPSTLSFLDRPVSVVWTVQFNPLGPSTLTQDRPL